MRRTALALFAAAAAAAGPPFYLLDPEAFAPVLGRDFAEAAATIPLFESSSRALTLAYYFRWRVYLSHVHPTGSPAYPFVVTEFAPNVPWAGSNNTIPCAAVHHVREGRWARNGTVMDSYTAWWTSGEPGVRHNYFASHAKSVLDRLHVAGRAANLPLVEAVLPNLTALVAAYLAGTVPANAAYDPVHDCVWNAPGNEGQERSISGPGCRPLVQALLYGEAAAVAELCGIAGNASCAQAFAGAADAFQGRLFQLWNANLSSFDTWQEGSPPPGPPPPPPPMPKNFVLFTNASIFCCDQSPCKDGHSTFLYEGQQDPAGCASICDNLAACHYATVDPSGSWCQAAQFCNTTNPFGGGPAFTFVKTNASSPAAASAAVVPAPPPLPFAGVRELASLTSPWYFGAVTNASSAALYAPAWAAAFDTEGFFSTFGLRTAEARNPGYGCHPAACCYWDGPVWPFETAKALTAAAAVLHEAELGPSVPQLSRAGLYTLLEQYTAMHDASAADNGTDPGLRPWLITNSSDGGQPADYAVLNASGLFLDGLGAHWIAEAGCGETGQWTDDPMQGYLYLHSSYVDVVLTAVVGLVPRAGDSPPTLTVHPLQPADGTLAWWAADGLLVGGRVVTVWWDADGSRYGRGAGLHVLLDGAEAATAPTTQGPPIVVPL